MMTRKTPNNDTTAGVHYFQKYDHTVMETAQVLGYSASTIYRWIRTGKITAKKAGKQIIVPLPSIIYWNAVGGQAKSV